jgi:hypothetical protein
MACDGRINEDNIQMVFYKSVWRHNPNYHSIQLHYDWVQWWAFVNLALNLWKALEFLNSWKSLIFSRGLLTMGSVQHSVSAITTVVFRVRYQFLCWGHFQQCLSRYRLQHDLAPSTPPAHSCFCLLVRLQIDVLNLIKRIQQRKKTLWPYASFFFHPCFSSSSLTFIPFIILHVSSFLCTLFFHCPYF